jgi:hypothetical protein
MIAGMNEQDLVAYIIFGIVLNFVMSILFGMYLSKNIGMQEMIESKGDKPQSLLVSLSLFVPYAKVLVTLYRVAILQIYFLDKGYTHKEFWVYITNK